MAKRTVAVGGMTYTGPNGVPVFALHGEEVDVQPDDLERFDRLNGTPKSDEDDPKSDEDDSKKASKPKG